MCVCVRGGGILYKTVEKKNKLNPSTGREDMGLKINFNKEHGTLKNFNQEHPII